MHLQGASPQQQHLRVHALKNEALENLWLRMFGRGERHIMDIRFFFITLLPMKNFDDLNSAG